MSLKRRLERLERREQEAQASGLPPLFWEAVYEEVPLERVPPETRQVVSWMRESSRDEPNLCEFILALAERGEFIDHQEAEERIARGEAP